MKFMSGRLPALTIATVFAVACSADLPTDATSLSTVAAKGSNTPAYTTTDIGKLLGFSSQVWGVNDAGDVVGVAFTDAGASAFAIIGGVSTALPGAANMARSISNSDPYYVVGYRGATTREPLRWTITNGEASQPTILDLGSATYAEPMAVNDAGEAAGIAGGSAAIWSADGSLTLVAAPADFPLGRGWGINNSGDAVFVFFPAAGGQPGRAALRLASGVLIELPPLSGDVGVGAFGISDQTSGAVYIAGTSRSASGTLRAVRWTVDVTTGTIVETRFRPEDSQAQGVSNSGAVAGVVRARKSYAFLWRETTLLALNPPKGFTGGSPWSISRSGEYVGGEVYSPRTGSNALLWRILSP